jgi:hypothetical protein
MEPEARQADSAASPNERLANRIPAHRRAIAAHEHPFRASV